MAIRLTAQGIAMGFIVGLGMSFHEINLATAVPPQMKSDRCGKFRGSWQSTCE
jgi:hypothetical protein